MKRINELVLRLQLGILQLISIVFHEAQDLAGKIGDWAFFKSLSLYEKTIGLPVFVTEVDVINPRDRKITDVVPEVEEEFNKVWERALASTQDDSSWMAVEADIKKLSPVKGGSRKRASPRPKVKGKQLGRRKKAGK